MDEIQVKLWKNEQEILDVVHEICISNGLRYSLAYGTLLGAVRHRGFIPWDDDIDILMPREDFEKLLIIWKNTAPADYILQEPYSSPDLVINFAKIRKDHTTFIQSESEKERKYHKGIFVDVFPVDRLARGTVSQKYQKIFCLISMLFNRGYTSGTSGIVGFGERVMLAVVPKGKYRDIERWAKKKATRWNGNKDLEWFGFQTVRDMKHHYAPDIFEDLTELEFEQKKYYAFRNYDRVLRDEFGDYMQLPPEEERVWKHHPIIIDFEHNYEELSQNRGVNAMDEPIRVLHVIGIMNRGGAETMIMNLYRNIDRTAIQFDFVENDGETAAFDEEIQMLGGRIYRCPRYNGKNHFTYTRWWNSFFEAHEDEYPIVHGHIGSTAAIYLSIAKKYGAYTIAHSHSAGAGSVMYRIFAYPTRYIADHFFACSKAAGVSRYGKKVGNDSNLCQVLNNAIDTRKFVFSQEIRQQMRSTLYIAENAFVIGHVGRFVEAKNHLFLIDIFANIRKRNKNAVLLLVGDGELRPEIEAAITEKHLDEAVILAGVRPNVWDYYQAMDVFVFPSIYEGLPVSMVEAQAAGLPCCASANVPKDTAITDLVEFLPLEDGSKKWAESALRRSQESRHNMLNEIQNAGFDVSSTAKWLENFYMNVVTSRGK